MSPASLPIPTATAATAAVATGHAATAVRRELQATGSPQRAAELRRFFKTGPGEYAEGDQFWGVSSPDTRAIARRCLAAATLDDLAPLLASPWHEERFAALAVLVERAKRAMRTSTTDADAAGHRALADFYLAHRAGVNNWDLVDVSAPWVLGPVACDEPETLWALARSGNLWEERIAMLSAFFDIRRRHFDLPLKLARHFLHHPHDLMHKAVGWMLREAGKRDAAVLAAFLDAHAATMPRTMLRYAIEKLADARRRHYLAAARRG
jgi:3-methyladenine DNA glycosylase AlkD